MFTNLVATTNSLVLVLVLLPIRKFVCPIAGWKLPYPQLWTDASTSGGAAFFPHRRRRLSLSPIFLFILIHCQSTLLIKERQPPPDDFDSQLETLSFDLNHMFCQPAVLNTSVLSSDLMYNSKATEQLIRHWFLALVYGYLIGRDRHKSYFCP